MEDIGQPTQRHILQIRHMSEAVTSSNTIFRISDTFRKSNTIEIRHTATDLAVEPGCRDLVVTQSHLLPPTTSASSWVPFGMRPVPWALFVLDKREIQWLESYSEGQGPVGRTVSNRKQPQRKEGEIEPDDDIDTNVFEDSRLSVESNPLQFNKPPHSNSGATDSST
ncbi:hypothetical protein K438DRAFT_1780609 [Mycena galopus ATCC 62051]|nr:hypothetical protein K438DRAFT_1780609 [Mycena galopus ATCC 62051]